MRRLKAEFINLVCTIHYNLKVYFGWKEPVTKPEAKLCIIHFTYDCKGVYGAGKNKRESVFAYVEDGANTHDCLPLFTPPGIGKAHCTVTEILVMPLKTVVPLPHNHEQDV